MGADNMNSNSWKAKEKGTYELVTETIESLSDLKWSKDKYSSFDAYNDLAIVEFKYRHQAYADTLIEKMKYENLKALCSGKIALYIVEAEDTIYIFNLNRLHKAGWDYKWEMRDCNATTHFNNKNKKPKMVGYIDWEQADITIDRDTKEVTRR